MVHREKTGCLALVAFWLLLSMTGLPLSGADEAETRDPDRRVDVRGGIYAATHTSLPAVDAQGDRVFSIYIDRRYFASNDPFFHTSVNQNGTWRGSDTRLNTNYPVGNLESSMRQVLVKAMPNGSLYVLMIHANPERNGYFNASSNQGETWLASAVSVGAGGVEAAKLGWRLAATVGGRIFAAWYDNRDNLATGNYNVYFTRSINGGSTWTPASSALNIRESSLISENIERGSEPALCASNDRVYVVFKDKRNPSNNNDAQPVPGRIRLRYSIDFGATWRPSGTGAQETRLDTGDAAMTESQNPEAACTDGSTVMAVWEDFRNGNWDVYFNISTDSGATFRPADVRVDDGPAGSNANLPRILLGDGTPKKIYAVWKDDREGRTDLRFSVSADQGVTWSASRALNVPPGNAWPQGPVSVTSWDVAADGANIVVVWADSRHLPENPGYQDVFAVTSADGGATFSAPERISLGKGVATSATAEIDAAATGGGFTAVYRDYRNDPVYSDIFGGGWGRVFDAADPDGDGRTNGRDNCPDYPNATQQDTDYDRRGDLCDSFITDAENDHDGDGINPATDKCPDINDFLQEDTDLDGYGNVCDRCPSQVDDVVRDLDRDGQGDGCDTDIDGDGVVNTGDSDDDNDTRPDTGDNCPAVPNARQLDDNTDGQGNDCDVDDQLVQGVRIAPLAQAPERMTWEKEKNITGYNVYFGPTSQLSAGTPAFCYRPQLTAPRTILPDDPPPGTAFYFLICTLNGTTQGGPGKGSAGSPARQVPSSCTGSAATDWDADTFPNYDDNCPLQANASQADDDGDGRGNVCDLCPLDPDNDLDRDQVCGNLDNCPTVFNPDQRDTDQDGTGDACAGCPDADGDTICNAVDNCPAVFNPDQLDFDQDHTGDACDADDDADGVPDAADCAPLDPTAWSFPSLILGLRVEQNGGTRVLWTAPGPGTVTDLAGGALDLLRGDLGVGAAACLADNQAGGEWLDPRPGTPAGDGYYYIARGQNGCGGGSWGTTSAGTERTPLNACP